MGYLVKDTTRSLEQISEILRAPNDPESVLSDLLLGSTPLNVLEVGFGWGRALLELAWRFRNKNVSFYGIDKTQLPPMEKREDLLEISKKFDIIPQSDITDFKLPKLYFYDASCMQFDDESMDFIYSAVAIRFMEYKAEFLEEVCRVLKPGGVAVLHFSETNWNYPYSRICDDRVLTPYTNRFVLKYRDELIPLPIYLKLFVRDRFLFNFTFNESCKILVSKLKPGRLNLQLDYNDKLSLKGKKLPLRNEKGEVRGGFRSVYNVRSEVYQELFDKGLLVHDQLRTDIHFPEE